MIYTRYDSGLIVMSPRDRATYPATSLVNVSQLMLNTKHNHCRESCWVDTEWVIVQPCGCGRKWYCYWESPVWMEVMSAIKLGEPCSHQKPLNLAIQWRSCSPGTGPDNLAWGSGIQVWAVNRVSHW